MTIILETSSAIWTYEVKVVAEHKLLEDKLVSINPEAMA